MWLNLLEPLIVDLWKRCEGSICRWSSTDLRQNHLFSSGIEILFEQNILNMQDARNISRYVHETNQVEWQLMTKDAQVLSVDRDFVVLVFGKDNDLERLVSLDQTLAVPFFHSPSATLERVAHNDFLV